MRLFQMKPLLDGVNMMEKYLEDKFISFGWQGIDNLEQVSQQELLIRLAGQHTGEQSSPSWEEHWQEIQTFVYEMQDGDYVIVVDEGIAYIGDLGDYFYVQMQDNEEVNTAHRRGVTWLESVLVEQCSQELQSFVEQNVAISVYNKPVTKQLIERWMSGDKQQDGHDTAAAIVSSEIIEEALAILQEAMRSNDIERRERAAIAILQFAKR